MRRGRSRHRERPARLPRRRRRAARARRSARRRAARPAPPAGRRLDATGENLAVPGTIVLTVGSDCAIGKMTVSLELDLEARRRGLRSVFVPTGQTGSRSPAGGSRSTPSSPTSSPARPSGSSSRAQRGGGELLWVEGQGSLLHPVYSGVTLGLYHGSVRTCSSSATRPGAPRSRAPAAGRTRSRRSATSSSCTSGSRCRRGRRASPRRAQHARARRGRGPGGGRRGRGRDGPPGRRSGPLRRGQARRRGPRGLTRKGVALTGGDRLTPGCGSAVDRKGRGL